MKVLLNHPQREVELKGPKRVREVLAALNQLPEAVLVIRNDELLTEDETLSDSDLVEIRPVISGGAHTLLTRGRPHVFHVEHPSGHEGGRT